MAGKNGLEIETIPAQNFRLYEHRHMVINSNYILFTKLPWLGDNEVAFWSFQSSCSSVNRTRRRLHPAPLIAERQAGKLWIPIFIIFGLTLPGIEPQSTASVADALSTRPLISC